MTLNLSTEQFDTIARMVDFATTHAADGMAPAMAKDFDNLPEGEFRDAFKEQFNKITSVRELLGLEKLGDYAYITDKTLIS
jgi:hypothetical protein